VDIAEALWREHLKRLGAFLKAQRLQNQLSQRQLARMADLSDAYMSQLERGLHEPSIRVLRALADSLGIRPEQLIMYAAGLPLDTDTAMASSVSTEGAIRADGRLSDDQKRALLSVLKSYVHEADRATQQTT